ncbi:hypothetical protein [Aquirufa ecclesiirivi]|uniref:hypothetical protein n=1 Tax=Aquirufa ecclesiirivi TaxID=2715124 RepID=UPI0014086A0B|nr:hypothetical protein [Aquirufa ecclesiirivi]MCZ2473463.1 hypothetical protein [Aquirufa ecclesiirivi]NHC48280.1 hypothetical protein [Aquirufa ecclesiirivi]
MGTSSTIRWILTILFTLLIQVLFLRDLTIAYFAFCFIYVWPLVKAPIDTPPAYLMLGAFVLGWLVDVFYNTHGMHAFASVLMVSLRSPIFRLLTPANGYDERSSVSLQEMRPLWFFSYLFLMLFCHHSVLFLLEASDLSLLGISLLRGLSSCLLGLLVFGILELFNLNK